MDSSVKKLDTATVFVCFYVADLLMFNLCGMIFAFKMKR
jgi:hypothetical protein